MGFNTHTDLDTKVVNRLSFMINTVSPLLTSGIFKESKVCEDQINNYLFDLEYFTRLAKVAKRLVIISGYKTSIIENLIQYVDIPNIIIEIPTHNSLNSREDSVSSNLSLPHVYTDILHTLKNIRVPGDLCLVSAGFIRKMFVSECVIQGGVAMDIGQVLGRLVNEVK